MKVANYINILLLFLDWLHRVNARLMYDYNNATLERVQPLIDKEFIRRIFPDYPCLFFMPRPESYIHGVIVDILYKQLSLDIAILHTKLVHSNSVCRGLIIVSTSMNVSVDFIMQNKPFHKNMRIYIILIKYLEKYLFFQEHWSRELLDMEVLVITVFPRQIKVYRLHSYSSEFKMVGIQRKTDYFPSNEYHTEYAKYYSMESSIQDRISRLENDNYAFYGINLNNLFFMDVEDISPRILTKLRTFRTCLGQYFVSFGLRLGTSYLEQVDNIILRLRQSGIIDYWLTNTIVFHFGFNPFNRMYEYKPQNKRNNHKPLSLASLEVRQTFQAILNHPAICVQPAIYLTDNIANIRSLLCHQFRCFTYYKGFTWY
ncbi:hypothetical protein WDU94_004989 [Cyamophila willieti]